MTSTTIEYLFLCHNRLGVVTRCFKSLLAGLVENEQQRWIILDNGSRDGTADWLLKFANRYPRIDLTLSAHNLGVAGGRQVLLDRARADIIAFLDSDVEALTPDWSQPLLAALQDKTVGAVGPSGHWLNPEWNRFTQAREPGEVDVLAGYCQFMRREVLSGFKFDPFFNPYGHEDSDMCLWLRERGYSIQYEPVDLRHIFANSANASNEDSQLKLKYLRSKFAGKGLIQAERATP